ncbi:unnamed protein product [Ostreobium quekettii]|uniref:Peptidase S1 domain-containing protein n=1 Tax=Ostreobium quekettii TaxID=121088 RepID=A0A8S1IY71_9CHLO|nr:unnamed protein product [Ostreobium quekettii]
MGCQVAVQHVGHPHIRTSKFTSVRTSRFYERGWQPTAVHCEAVQDGTETVVGIVLVWHVLVWTRYVWLDSTLDSDMLCFVWFSNCTGDEGGPVLRLGEDASGDVQVGVATSQIVDQGVECGLFGKPSKFTGLEHLLDWINDVVNGTR